MRSDWYDPAHPNSKKYRYEKAGCKSLDKRAPTFLVKISEACNNGSNENYGDIDRIDCIIFSSALKLEIEFFLELQNSLVSKIF